MKRLLIDQEQTILKYIEWCHEWLDEVKKSIEHYDTSNIDLFDVQVALIDARKACSNADTVMDTLLDEAGLY